MGGKLSFLDDAVPFTSSFSNKFWEISGNHSWHCYFEGLMAYIITLYFLLSPPVFCKLGLMVVLYCTVLYRTRITPEKENILLVASCLQTENTNAPSLVERKVSTPKNSS